MLITDPAVLTALETYGLTLTKLFGGASGKSSNAELSQLPGFAPVIGVLEQEVRRAADEDKLAGVDVARFSHRLFDVRFLRSAQARFRLAGVVNRPDRAAFAQGSCGEVRLIYRLSYDRGAERASKLPMTLGIEAAPGDPVGQCLPAEREVGDACESGNVKPKADRRYDRMGTVRAEERPGMVCNRSSVGFPAGMCTARCGAPGAVCGPIAVLDSFNACLARGESFLTCILGNVNPAGLRGCDESHACRDDYICARGQDGGVCLPPYFVFQLCVDGH